MRRHNLTSVMSQATQLENESCNEGARQQGETSTATSRGLLDTTLKNYKQNKLKRKLPIDMQLLACVEEELGIKRRLADRLEHMDKEFNENMTLTWKS